MPLSEQVTQVTEVLANDLAEGRSSRQSVGGEGPAFGWTSGLPITVANFCQVAQADGLSFPVTRVAPSGTPAAKVAEGAAKPNAATITSGPVTLEKFAGLGIATMEQILNAAGLLPAITSVLGAGALIAFEADAMGEIAAAGGPTATGATWVAALTAGQAAVLSRGGVPGLAIVSAADYGAVVGEIAGGAGFSQDPESAVGAFLGSRIHVSPGAPAGTAYVADPGALLAVEHKDSPVVTVDPFTMADTNKTRVVADLFAQLVVTNAAHVVKVTKGAAE